MQTQPSISPFEEQLSALVDGELSPSACATAFAAMRSSPDAAQQWNTYQLIGDALRSGQGSAGNLSHGADPEFLRRLGLRLATEQVAPVELPLASPYSLPATLPATAPNAIRNGSVDSGGTVNPLLVKDAANDGAFRWKMLAGFACMGTVAAIAWGVVGSGSAGSSAQMAQSSALAAQQQVVVASPQGLVVRDARLEELLAAHKQMGGTSLPVPSGFVRNANFENQPKNPR